MSQESISLAQNLLSTAELWYYRNLHVSTSSLKLQFWSDLQIDEGEDRNKPKQAFCSKNKQEAVAPCLKMAVSDFFSCRAASVLIMLLVGVCGGCGPAVCSVMWVTVRRWRQWFESRVCSHFVQPCFNLPSFLCASSLSLSVWLIHIHLSLSPHVVILLKCLSVINSSSLDPERGSLSRAVQLTPYQWQHSVIKVHWIKECTVFVSSVPVPQVSIEEQCLSKLNFVPQPPKISKTALYLINITYYECVLMKN